MNKEALIFDLDDTLIPSQQIYRDSVSALGFEQFSGPYGDARKLVKSTLPEYHVSAHNRLLYFKEILCAQNSFSPAELFTLNQTYEKLLQENVAKFWLTSGRQGLMQKLAQKYKIAICTNETLRTQMLKLHAMDPNASWLSVLVCSEELGVEKPAAAPFLKTLKVLGVPAKACLMVGDSVANDIQGAESVGIAAVQVTEFQSKNMEGAHAKITSVFDLPKFLESSV